MNKLYEEFHTEECKQAYNKFLHEYQLWMDQWGSTCCQVCFGKGGGIEFNYPQAPDNPYYCFCIDPIDDSLSHCPRCGFIWEMEQSDEKYASNIIVQDELPCPMCGWNWGKNPGDVKPEWYGCECYTLEPESYGVNTYGIYFERFLKNREPKKIIEPDIDFLGNHPFGSQEKYIPGNDYFVQSDFAYDENKERNT